MITVKLIKLIHVLCIKLPLDSQYEIVIACVCSEETEFF